MEHKMNKRSSRSSATSYIVTTGLIMPKNPILLRNTSLPPMPPNPDIQEDQEEQKRLLAILRKKYSAIIPVTQVTMTSKFTSIERQQGIVSED